MSGLPTGHRIDPLALFTEINEFVSFHELLEPLSPYSSDSDSISSPEDELSHLSALSIHPHRSKSRYKNVNNINSQLSYTPKDPSDDPLFQMLARGSRKKNRDPSMNQQNSSSIMTNCGIVSTKVNEDSIKSREICNNQKTIGTRNDRVSYFSALDQGLSKYPTYLDYVNNFKKPFKQIEPSSSNVEDEIDFNCSMNPPSPDLNPDILSALDACFSNFSN